MALACHSFFVSARKIVPMCSTIFEASVLDNLPLTSTHHHATRSHDGDRLHEVVCPPKLRQFRACPFGTKGAYFAYRAHLAYFLICKIERRSIMGKGSGGGKGNGGSGSKGSSGGSGSKGSSGASQGGNWPSTTGNPSGGGRGNNPPKK